MRTGIWTILKVGTDKNIHLALLVEEEGPRWGLPWWNVPGQHVLERSVPGCNVPATERSLGQSVPRTEYPLGTDSPSQIIWQKGRFVLFDRTLYTV
jgi:hypothetical protein